MASKVTVELTDDLDGSTGNIETVQFGLDGKHYEIDLCEKNAAELRSSMNKWVSSARRKRNRSIVRPVRTPGGKLTDDGIRLEDVRVWAVANGYTVSQRGRVAASIIDAYRAGTVTTKKAPAKKAPVKTGAAKVEKALAAAKAKLGEVSVDMPEFSEADK